MSERSPTYFSAEAVRRVLSWELVNEAVEEALKAAASTSQPEDQAQRFVSQPQRSFTRAGPEPGKLLLTMPAYVGNYRLSTTDGAGDGGAVSTLACKLVTSFRSNSERQPALPNIAAHILLFSVETGELDTIMAGTDITTWRTVAASLVATKHLYFRRFGPHAEQQLPINVAIIGCGVQGQAHAAAMCAQFRVKQLTLYNRTESRALQLRDDLLKSFDDGGSANCHAGTRPEVKVCSTPREACAQADVICVATFSSAALVTADCLAEKRPIHINTVGAGEVHYGEVSADIYRQSLVYVDCNSNAEHELRGLPQPLAMAELGAVILQGNYPNRESLTIFQSMGECRQKVC
ncbi:hypothetical protein KR222_004726, partial [Zaprionus bogoriensis]